MRRLIQSIAGGFSIFGLLACWTGILWIVFGTNPISSLLMFILLAPGFVFSLVFDLEKDDLFGMPRSSIFLLGFIFQIGIFSLVSYLLIELTDHESGFRSA